MNEGDAKFILGVLCRVDGGCCSCASYAIKDFLQNYPEHEQLAREIYLEAFDMELKLK
jgi:hypothetical protein